MEKLELIINEKVNQFKLSIIEKHSEINISDLHKMWDDISSNIQKPIPQTIKKINSSKIIDQTISNGCPYEFIKGESKGTICKSKPITGQTYCSRHKKHEGSIKKEKKITPIAKNTKDEKQNSPVKTTLVKHKTSGKIWHPETKFVFKSPKEIIVIGKILNDNVIDLTPDDLKICKQWKFAFDSKFNDSKESLNLEDDDDLKSDCDEDTQNIIKNFIPNALGLKESNKKNKANDSDSDDDIELDES